nr:hypothetical protein [Sphingomonas folli]
MIEAESGVGHLPAFRRDLQNTASALHAQVRQNGADELDRRRQIGCDLAVDLKVGELFRRTEQAVASVAHNDIDPPVGKRGIDDPSDRGRVRHVEVLDRQLTRVARLQRRECLNATGSCDHRVTAL